MQNECSVFECFSIDGENQCDRNSACETFFVFSKTGEKEAIQKRISLVSFEEALAHFSFKALLKKGKIIYPLLLILLNFSFFFAVGLYLSTRVDCEEARSYSGVFHLENVTINSFCRGAYYYRIVRPTTRT